MNENFANTIISNTIISKDYFTSKHLVKFFNKTEIDYKQLEKILPAQKSQAVDPKIR
ncbi:hypothetical protein [Trichodesmium erythraeum]|uniref:hypothetical protein n=1 Tax=Trichodesmium erythraeum TaxID=1206 RepID=UPI0003121507|nr:hypothetical protein [Trichodesmium sp. St11_bin5]